MSALLRLRRPLPVLPTPVQAALWMVFSSSVFAFMNLLVRLAGEEVHPFVVVFFRCLFSLLFLLPWVLRSGVSSLRTQRGWLYFTRALTGLVSMISWFYGVTLMPLGQSVALNFTTPLFTTVGAALLLGEVVRRRRWTATLVGFLGVLILVRPSPHSLDGGAMIVLLSAAAGALSNLQVRTLAKTEPTAAMVTYMVLFLTPMSLVPALTVWQWPSLHVLALLVLIGAVATVGHLSVTRALHLAEASAIMPLDYIKLPLSVMLGWVWFGEVMDTWSWVGAGVIIGSTVYIAHREAQLARTARVQPAWTGSQAGGG